MKKILFTVFLILVGFSISFAQIFGPEGLNIPGAFNSWSNPPSVNSFGGIQKSGGTFLLITTGTHRYKTTINVQSSGGDCSGGTYDWLFTSGPTDQYYNNKWAGVTVSLNTLQTYSFNTGANNSITLTDGKYYTVAFQDNGYANSDAIWMETSAEPVTITTVTDNFLTRGSGNDGTVSITLNTAKSTEEKIFVRYTTDGWSTSTFVEASGSGTSYTAAIPDAAIAGYNGNDEYYVLSSTVTSPSHATADMVTINLNNNGGSNYQLPVELVSFSGIVNGKNILLKWNTATEKNNSGFEIQRKQNDHWSAIGFVNGNGTSNTAHEYSFSEKGLNAGSYSYRLKQIDRDGKVEFSRQIETTVALNEIEYSLSQNYPNPFNPTTVFTFAVKEKQIAKVSVLNLLGQEVEVLFNGEVEPNIIQTVRFTGSNLSSGVYFYSLTTNGRHEIKKLTLLK